MECQMGDTRRAESKPTQEKAMTDRERLAVAVSRVREWLYHTPGQWCWPILARRWTQLGQHAAMVGLEALAAAKATIAEHQAIIDSLNAKLRSENAKASNEIMRAGAELAAAREEVEQLRRIRELCITALVRATGASREAIEDGPLTCAVANAKQVAATESRLSAEQAANKVLAADYGDLEAEAERAKAFATHLLIVHEERDRDTARQIVNAACVAREQEAEK
jgi:hypothetical protein